MEKVLDIEDVKIRRKYGQLEVEIRDTGETFEPNPDMAQMYHSMLLKQEYHRMKEFFDLFPVSPNGQFMTPRQMALEYDIEVKENYWSKDSYLVKDSQRYSGPNEKVWVFKSIKIPLELIGIRKGGLNWVISMDAGSRFEEGDADNTEHFIYTAYPATIGLFFEAFIFMGDRYFEGATASVKESFDEGKILISNDKIKVYMGVDHRKQKYGRSDMRKYLKTSKAHDIPLDSPPMFSKNTSSMENWNASVRSLMRDTQGNEVEPVKAFTLGYQPGKPNDIHGISPSGDISSSTTAVINFLAVPNWENKLKLTDVAHHHYQTKRLFEMHNDVVQFPKILVPETKYGLLNHRIF